MPRINPISPSDWRDLQTQVALLFSECGLKSETEKKIQTVRGLVEVDVYAEDGSTQPTTAYLCECKHWQQAIPKTVVHAFRTVVADYGANWGFIISKAGFQSGAHEAAHNTNIRLFTWEDFESLFLDRWITQYMVPRLAREIDPLIEYTEPINSRIFRKADQLDEAHRRQFIELRNQYAPLAFLALPLTIRVDWSSRPPTELPLRKSVASSQMDGATGLPEDILDAGSLRELADILCQHATVAIHAFDEIFGGRA